MIIAWDCRLFMMVFPSFLLFLSYVYSIQLLIVYILHQNEVSIYSNNHYENNNNCCISNDPNLRKNFAKNTRSAETQTSLSSIIIYFKADSHSFISFTMSSMNGGNVSDDRCGDGVNCAMSWEDSLAFAVAFVTVFISFVFVVSICVCCVEVDVDGIEGTLEIWLDIVAMLSVRLSHLKYLKWEYVLHLRFPNFWTLSPSFFHFDSGPATHRQFHLLPALSDAFIDKEQRSHSIWGFRFEMYRNIATLLTSYFWKLPFSHQKRGHFAGFTTLTLLS